MSGYTSFKKWIDEKANTLNDKGVAKKIIETFFTSSPVPNLDNFNIKLEDGTIYS